MPMKNIRSSVPEIIVKNSDTRRKTLVRNPVTMPMKFTASSFLKTEPRDGMPEKMIPDSPPLSPASSESNCSKENESTISGIANAFENLNIKMPSQNVEIKIADQSSNAGFSSLMDEFCTMGGV